MSVNIPPHGLFITGTNTDVGKTYITSLIARELIAQGTKTGIYKPVCSGVETDESGHQQWSDVRQLAQAMGAEDDIAVQNKICPQCYLKPVAPPLAAAAEGKQVDEKLLTTGLSRWVDDAELMLVEGVGGLLCPLTESTTVADFAKEIGYPIIIVAAVELGMINHTLLTIEVAQSRQLTVAGIVFNVISSTVSAEQIESNRQEISSRTQVPILSIVQQNQTSDLRRLEQETRIEWCRLATHLE